MDRCVNSISERMLYFFMFAAAATIVFIVLTQSIVDETLAQVIPNPQYRYMVIVLLFFTIIYLFDRLIEGWRVQNHVCV